MTFYGKKNNEGNNQKLKVSKKDYKRCNNVRKIIEKKK